MASWGEFAAAEPNMAQFGADRFSMGVAYLATIRPDGAPRVYPVSPIIGEDQLLMFMKNTSPKGNDIKRDGRYMLHCAVTDRFGRSGEFYVSGHARHVEPGETRLWELAVTYGYVPKPTYILFVFGVENAMTTLYFGEERIRRRWKAAEHAAP